MSGGFAFNKSEVVVRVAIHDNVINNVNDLIVFKLK